MTDISSAGTGDWHTPATWVGGVVPGTGDRAVIVSGHTVTISNPVLAIKNIAVYGALVLNNDIIMDDAGGASIYFDTFGTLTTNASTSTWRRIQSAGGGSPNNPWFFGVRHVAGNSIRTIDMDYLVLSGNGYYLGSAAAPGYYVLFNYWAGYVAQHPSAITRDYAYNEHIIDGRTMGSRIYPRGSSAGRLTVKGYIPSGNMYWQVLEEIRANRRRVSFTSNTAHLPMAWIESLRWGEMRGNNTPFTMVLVEDR